MKLRLLAYWHTRIKDTWIVYLSEIKRVLKDPGVAIIFFVAGLVYPVLYNLIYYNNVVRDVPVAVVDMSASEKSRHLIHNWDATPEVKVDYACATMDEAIRLFKQQKVHGILYIPNDFVTNTSSTEKQATLSLYCDMSSFLYLKNVAMSANFVVLDESSKIQMERYENANVNPTLSQTLVKGIKSEEVFLFSPTGGYAHSLIPIVLVLIVYQTLFFGIVMLCGTAREEHAEVYFLPGRRRRYGVARIIVGRALAYFTFYMVIGSYCLILIPRLFDLPHVGNPIDIMMLLVPFIFSTSFLAMTVGSFIKERETGMVLLLFTSLILLFLAGASWPVESMPAVVRWLSYAMPSTWGIHGFVHISSMGATISTTSREYLMLWYLFIAYGVLVYVVYLIKSTVSKRRFLRTELAKRRQLILELRQRVRLREQQMFNGAKQHFSKIGPTLKSPRSKQKDEK